MRAYMSDTSHIVGNCGEMWEAARAAHIRDTIEPHTYVAIIGGIPGS